MKIYSIPIVWLFILILITGMLIGSVPQAHAQSVEGWTEPVNLSNSGSSTNPSIVIDTEGMFHVFWIDEFDGYKYVNSVDGVNWTSPKTVSVPFPDDTEIGAQPVFLAGNNGTIHILWNDEDGRLQYRTALSSKLGEPSTWTGALTLADSAVHFSAVVDSQGALHVGYLNSLSADTAPAGLYYRHIVGSRWSEAINIYSSSYFRSLVPENANIHLATSDASDMVNVYIAWDDRSQKRIFLAKSVDGGQTWDEVEQVKGPEEITGYQTPSNGEIHAFGKTALLLWQVGESSNQCVQYSQSITNDGNGWGEPIKILDEFVGCPTEAELFSLDENLSLLLLNIQGGISLIAWNGKEWSDLQLQNELLELFNPTTFDSILLGCQQFSLHNNMLYVVGCDQESSGDIWFTSRSLGPLENWFPSLSSWNPTGLITNTEQMISSLTSVAHMDSVHLFWVQSARAGVDGYAPSIQYSRWNGEKWSSPRSIISNLMGNPLQIFVTKDLDGRMLLVWVDGKDGNLYFSWADSERAGLSSEWIQPEIVPSNSQLSSSPDMLVDASGRIIIAYTISLNEDRGIYIVQSTDLGSSWSSPMRAYDAVSAGWEIIDNPKISLSGDGRLHLFFNRYSIRNDDQSMGLFYMQSTDGGITWNEPELVKEGLITWSDIYSYDQQTVHRIWQEKNGLEVSYIDQLSFDGGLTWEVPVKVIGTNEETTQVSLAMDQVGSLHLAQLTYGKEASLQDWEWDGSRWILLESKELNLKGDGTRYSISNGITSDGNSVVSIMFEYSDLAGKKTDEMWGFYRLLEITERTQDLFLPIVPTPQPILTSAEAINITPTTVGDVSPLANLNESPSTNRKDLVGLFLVVAIVVLTVVIIKPKSKKR